jgi:hypothetical protein
MDKPRTTAKDFFLWAGAMIAFYWTVTASILLIFEYINYAFPDALTYYQGNPYQGGISYQMASIVVFLPLYMLLMKFIRSDISRDPSKKEIWVRRWALILTLFVAGFSIAIDLVTLLNAFFNGESLTAAFLLKVLIIFLIAALAFMHFVADLKGYWNAFPMRRRYVGIGVAILAIVVIGSGFFILGTPAQARLVRFDVQKVSDLQNIQSQVVNYWQAKQKLPIAINDLSNSLSYGPLPIDAQTGESYVYQATGALSFKLCATFNAESRTNQGSYAQPVAVAPTSKTLSQDNWQHGVGPVCFERTIDPSFYPPLK